jgi:hypothetical protein
LSITNPHLLYRATRPVLLFFAIPFFLWIILEGNSLSTESQPCALPEDYGQVVCRFNEKSPNQLYVIGITHRDSLTRSNGSRTARVQAEVYKIGEWLIRNQGVELLLPEGFFTMYPKNRAEKEVRSGSLPAGPREGNMEFLEQRFSDDRRFVNAEMLLKENFPLLLRQVEDKDLYQTVSDNIRLLAESKKSMEKNFLIRSELDYYQKKRVGTMLQRIPGIVNEEFREKHIDNKKALFTIGLSHISDIIRYMEERKITVLSPLFTPVKYEDYIDELNLAKEDFGISVIIPKTLVNDHEVMEKNNLKVF